jgi:hypothetical protein
MREMTVLLLVTVAKETKEQLRIVVYLGSYEGALSAEGTHKDGQFCDIGWHCEDIVVIGILIDHIFEGFALGQLYTFKPRIRGNSPL